MECIDKHHSKAECAGDLVSYILSETVIYRCSKHAMKHWIEMAKYGEYTIPTVNNPQITEEEIALFIHQLENL